MASSDVAATVGVAAPPRRHRRRWLWLVAAVGLMVAGGLLALGWAAGQVDGRGHMDVVIHVAEASREDGHHGGAAHGREAERALGHGEGGAEELGRQAPHARGEAVHLHRHGAAPTHRAGAQLPAGGTRCAASPCACYD